MHCMTCIACFSGFTDVASMLLERGADLWRPNELGENPIQAMQDPNDKRVLYKVLSSCSKLREIGYERWKRRKNFATFLSCYTLKLITRAAAADALSHQTYEGGMPNVNESRSAVVTVLKSKDLVRFISKYL